LPKQRNHKLLPPPQQLRLFFPVRIALGLLLLVTAGLKLYELLFPTSLPQSFLDSPALRLGSIEIEALVGLWLLSGWAQQAAWVAVLVLFGALAGASAYIGLLGHESCGCFGHLEISPWLVCAVDVALFVGLWFIRPSTAPAASPGILRVAGLFGLCGAGAIALLVTPALLAGNHPLALFASLRSEELLIEPNVVDVGDGAVGDQRMWSVRVTNRSALPRRVVGMQVKCGCVTNDELPVSLDPGESRALQFRTTFGDSPGPVQNRIVLYTDFPYQERVAIWFRGRVVVPEG
jgi:hypothetical protein